MSAPPAPPAAPLRQSPLGAFDRRHGGHMVPFAGWEMPLYYAGIMEEHRAVRTGVGMFDVSHMGMITVSGPRAAELLARRTTSNVPSLVPGQVRYTFLLQADGGIVDDLLISRLDDGTTLQRDYLAVPNGSRADEVEEILRHHRLPDTTIARWNPKVAILAVQGPRSRAVLEATFGWNLAGLAFYHVASFPQRPGTGDPKGHLGVTFPDNLTTEILVSRTGYTGERGYELFLKAEIADAVAERLLAAGVVPVGLGARDTLRLEQGYLLSGQEFHRDRTPIEAGQDRFVDLDHEFVGSPVLAKQKAEGPALRLAGIEVREPGAIPRHGTPVLKDGKPVAQLTSGGLSPTLQYGIAMAFLPKELAAPGTELALSLRGREVPARVVALPFRSPPKPGGA